ncbi:MAG: flagellar hook-length control protein FliK [Planctomycetota bacterium]
MTTISTVPTTPPDEDAVRSSAREGSSSLADLSFAATLGFVQGQQQAAQNAARDARGPREPDAGRSEASIDASARERRADRRAAVQAPGSQARGTSESIERSDQTEPRREPGATAQRRSESPRQPVSRPAGGSGQPATRGGGADADAAPAAGTGAQEPATGQASAVGGAVLTAPALGVSGLSARALVTSVSGGGSGQTTAGLGGRPASKPSVVFKLAQSPAPRGRSAEVARQVSRGLAQLLRSDGGSLRLKLAPNTLGEVQIDLRVSQGRVDGVLSADNDVARGLLDRELASLRAALEARGVTVDRLEVRSLAEPAGSPGGGSAEGRGASDGQDTHGAGSGRQQQRERGASRDRVPTERRADEIGGADTTGSPGAGTLVPERLAVAPGAMGRELTLRLDTLA